MTQLEDKYIAGEYTLFSGQNLDVHVHVTAEHVHQSGDENCLESEQQHPPPLKKQCTRNKGTCNKPREVNFISYIVYMLTVHGVFPHVHVCPSYYCRKEQDRQQSSKEHKCL